MPKSKIVNPLTAFFLKSIGITTIILIPLSIITNNLFEIEEWWKNNPYQGIWFTLPGVVILLRWLLKIIRGRTEIY